MGNSFFRRGENAVNRERSGHYCLITDYPRRVKFTQARRKASSELAIFENSDAIAIDRDALCIPGHRVQSNANAQVGVKPLVNGDVAVALWNRSTNSTSPVAGFRGAYTRTIKPARALVAKTLKPERALSDLANEACGLIPAEIDLMRQTAPQAHSDPGFTTGSAH